MKTLAVVALIIALLCGAAGWRAFEAPASYADREEAQNTLERFVKKTAAPQEIQKAELDYLYASEAIGFYRVIGRSCFVAALVFGSAALFFVIYGTRVRPNKAPEPTR